MKLQVYGKSDIGCVRTRNEDAIVWQTSRNEQNVIAILADGMGGQAGGDVASKTAVDICIKQLASWLEKDSAEIVGLSEAVSNAVSDANSQIRHLREADPTLSRMGTTLLLVCLFGEQSIVANVGDSRCYLLTQDSAKQITQDDTVAQAMVNDGSITASEVSRIPFKNILTKAIGTDPEVAADIQQFVLKQDEALMLCSDGLTGALDSQKWPSILSQTALVHQQVEALVDESIKHNASDNVSVILIRRQ